MKSFRAVRRIVNEDEMRSILLPKQLPAVLPGFATNWPAVTGTITTSQWSNWGALRSRLVKHHGPEEHDAHHALVVPLEFGGTYMDQTFSTQHVSFLSVLDTLLAEQAHIAKFASTNQEQSHQQQLKKNMLPWYLAQHDLRSVSPLLAQEVQVPIMLSTTSTEQGKDTSLPKPSIYRNNLWLGGHAGSVSPCHYDPFNNLLVQIYGSKRVLLFDPQNSAGLYPALGTRQKNTSCIRSFEHQDGLGGDASTGADADRYPLFKDVIGFEAILHPGDALYIPYKWWHHCSAASASCSVNWWFL